ncbi:MAG: hypothetical protein VB119_00455 [Candidatus Metalachnospira sp.]|nr:hypothetical protein [Candidatus Metalachnospira sp.]
MTFIGLVAGIIIFVSLWASLATGRISWLVTTFWAGIMLIVVFGAKRGCVVNGLCLFIAFYQTVISMRAINKVIIWNQSFKDKGVVLPIFIYLISLLLVGYCIVQVQLLGYVPDVMGVKGSAGIIRKIIDAIIIAVISVPIAYIDLLRFERFFSLDDELILLNCKFFTSNLGGGKISKGYYMYGINNGIKHHFRVTKRTYFMLRLEDRLVLKMKRDVRGNFFVIKNPCPKNLENVARRDLRLFKNIAVTAVVYIIFLIIIL